jgi:putative DNA primase/helicase
VFDTHHWLRDRTEHVDRLALDAIRERQRLALEITDDADKKKHVRFALDSESRARRDNLVRLARKIERIAITGDEWDTNPWMLGVQNGVVDLQSGRLRAGEATDFITKVAPVAFDPTARCPRWDRFMEEVFPGRPELGDYLQRVFGYALTGITSEQVFWILYGEGANGKSTMVEALMRDVLGSAYAWTMPFPTATWSDSMTEYQRASLVGQRLVRASEVSRREHLNEKLIKSLTGGEEVNARHPYGKPFQFTPVAKIVLLVNDKPVISDPSHGMWRRVKLVPFLRKFEGAEVDTSLTDTLTAEAEGILAWAVRGCLDWQRDGLRHPDIVQSETAKYQNESDVLSEFIAERCVEGPDAKVGAQAIFDEYRRWCDDRRLADADRLSQKGFGVRLRQRYTAVDGRTVTYRGVGLKSPDFAQRRDEL